MSWFSRRHCSGFPFSDFLCEFFSPGCSQMGIDMASSREGFTGSKVILWARAAFSILRMLCGSVLAFVLFRYGFQSWMKGFTLACVSFKL